MTGAKNNPCIVERHKWLKWSNKFKRWTLMLTLRELGLHILKTIPYRKESKYSHSINTWTLSSWVFSRVSCRPIFSKCICLSSDRNKVTGYEWGIFKIEQVHVVTFHLRNRHNQMNHHLYTKFWLDQSAQRPGTRAAWQHWTEHLLQTCPSYPRCLQRQVLAEGDHSVASGNSSADWGDSNSQ